MNMVDKSEVPALPAGGEEDLAISKDHDSIHKVRVTVGATEPEDHYKPHPICALFPDMTEDEFASLKEDIQVNGLRQPILVTSDNRNLDGRHRYRACQETDVEPVFEVFDKDDDAALCMVISLNLHRRHLSTQARRGGPLRPAAAKGLSRQAGPEFDLRPGRLRRVTARAGHSFSTFGNQLL